jgi:hypothetical protein
MARRRMRRRRVGRRRVRCRRWWRRRTRRHRCRARARCRRGHRRCRRTRRRWCDRARGRWSSRLRSRRGRRSCGHRSGGRLRGSRLLRLRGLSGFLRRLLRSLLGCLLGGALLGYDLLLARRRGLLRLLAFLRFLRLRLFRHDRPPDRSAVCRSRTARITRRGPTVATIPSVVLRSNREVRPPALASSKPPASDRRSPSRSARSDGPLACRYPPRSG